MKKFMAILLSVALCVVNLNFTTFAEEQRSSIVYLESVTGTIGETIDIPIGIKDNQGIISLVAEISYDNTALKLVSVDKDDDFWASANMTPGGDLSAQPYRIIWYDGLAMSDFAEDGTLATLSFEILKEGSHEIELSVSESDTFNSNFVSVPVEIINGMIEVISESATTETTISTTSTTTTAVTEETKPTTTTTNDAEESGYLNLDNVIGAVGETLSMSISIHNNPGIISLVAEITYDNTALKLISVDKDADFWTSANMTPGGDLNAQPYRIIWYDGLAKSDFTEDGMLATLSFEILKEGSHEIELSISESDTFNIDFVSVPIEASNGMIEALSESVTTETTISTTTTSTTETTTTSSMTTEATTTTSATTTTTTSETTTASTTTTPETTTTELELGDVNGDGEIDASDAAEILVEAAMIGAGNIGTFSDEQFTAADVNGDGEVDASDAAIILVYAAAVGAGNDAKIEDFV